MSARLRRFAGVLVAALATAGAAGETEQPAKSKPGWGPFEILGVEVAPGESRRASWRVSESFAGVSLETPVLVVRGAEAGPTLCITAGVHGDELNGMEVVRRVVSRSDPKDMRGTLVGVPVVNLHGFRRSSRYLPDRRDLNRHFPGRARGSSASRIAHGFFESVVRRCDFLVDMHTGSFHRTNLPQVRANLDVPETLELARGFGAGIVVHSEGTKGTLRRAAVEAGIPAITYEAGEPMRFHIREIERGADGVRNLLVRKRMLKRRRNIREPEMFRHTHWVRVDDGGILISRVRLGEWVGTGEVLGAVTDPLSSEEELLLAPHPGMVIGMALNQVVIPGFAAFHLGIREADLSEVWISDEDEDWRPESADPNGSEAAERDVDERPEE